MSDPSSKLSTSPIGNLARSRMGLPLLVLLGTTFLVWVLFASRPERVPVDSPERVWTVDAVEVRHDTVQPQLELFGEIVAGRRSELRALVAGPIVEMGRNFREGGQVQQGELLLRIDPFDFRTAVSESRSLLTEAEARFTKLERDLNRARKLYQEKNVSEQFVDDAALAVVEQEALVEQRRIAVERAERDMQESRLVAPYDGVISGLNADLGKQLTVNDKVADLIDTSRLEVRFSLSNAQFGRLLDSEGSIVGRPVEVGWSVGSGERSYLASIERSGAEIQAATGGVDVYAVIDTGGEQVALRPGAFVTVRVADKAYATVVELPDSALYGEDLIYVIRDGRLAERRIKVHGYSGTSMLVSSGGDPSLVDGDIVVTTQLREAGAGVKVEVR